MDMQETKPTHSSSDEHQTDFEDEEEMILAGIDEDDAKVSHGSSTPLKTSSTSVEQSFNMPSSIVVPMTSLSSTTSQSPSYVDVYSASTVNHNGQVYNSSMGMYAIGTNPLVYSSSISSIANMYPNTAASAGLSAQGIASLANPAAQSLSGQYPYSYAMPYSAAYVNAQGRYYFAPQTGTHASYPYATVQVPYQSSLTTTAAVSSTTEFTSPPITTESPSLMASSKAPRTTTITSKPKRKKDPSAPKNPLSAYLFFVTEQRAKLAGKSSKGFADLARDLGQQWKEMTDDEKSPYQEMAKRDKERFQFEKKAYERRRKNSNGPSSPKEDSAADLPFAEPV